MGSDVHRASIGIASCHRPLRGQCFDLSDRPPGTQDLFADLTQLRVCSHAQPPSGLAEGIEISGGGGSGFDDHQVVIAADIDDCDPRIKRGRGALEGEHCSEQLRVVRHEPVEVGRGQSQMVDSEEFGHGGPTVVQPLEGTWVAVEMSQHLAYQGELDRGFEADGKLLVPCRDTPRLLEEPDPALDFVSGLVFLTAEAGWAAAGRTPASTVADLVALLRNGVRGLPAAQGFADLPGGVSAVGQDVSGWSARISAADPRNANAGHDLGEHRGISPLSSGDHGGQGMGGGVDGQMNLGGQPTSRAAECVIVRPGLAAPFYEPGSVLVRSADRGIDRHLPLDVSGSIGFDL
ncbi:hypothetical protein ADK43_14085 [Streptomyces rimosus subsp. rimosus]|nr:hypothetical protein ADK43_14085 [Streptomyces rimosus subsp. rimosus]